MRSKIVRDCVNHIKEFGYPNVDNRNIFTDAMYSKLFKSILEQNLGINSFVDCTINDLLKEIEETNI